MRHSLAERLSEAGPGEARKFERKRVTLSARITDTAGKSVVDCTIRDISFLGAQISLPGTEAIADTIYLIDIANRVGYRANVAWWRPHAAGLALLQKFGVDESLPPNLEFLHHVLIEAKLQEIEALTAQGSPLAAALETAGISGAAYARWNSERTDGGDLAQRLWTLEAENASLRDLVTELTRR